MLNEFIKDTKIYRVKTPLDQEFMEEVPVQFGHVDDAQHFFTDAKRSRFTNSALERIAQNVAPRYGRYSRRRSPGTQELMGQLYSRIYSGDLTLVEVDYSLRLKSRKAIEFPEISEFQLSECCYETMIDIRQKLEFGKLLNLIFPGILFAKFFGHPQTPVKAVVVGTMFTITTTDWEQLATAMVGLRSIQRRGLFGNTKMEISHHLLRSEMKQVTYWQTMQKCILAS